MKNPMKLNWNTLLIAAIFPIFGWTGNEVFKEIKSTHDAIITMRESMLPRSDFEVQISQVRTRLSALELEIQKLKDNRP
jgi:hypothetical protein